MRPFKSAILIAAALSSSAIAARQAIVAAKPAPAHKSSAPVRRAIVRNPLRCPGSEAPVVDPQTGQTVCPPPQFSYSN
jgi:hypothetical protein